MMDESFDTDEQPDLIETDLQVVDSADEAEDLVSSGLIIAGSSGSSSSGDDDLESVPNKPVGELTETEQKKLADHIMNEIDSNDSALPMLPLNTSMFVVWSFENTFMPPDIPGGDPVPAVIITFASPENPRGTPFVLSRDRMLKFCSQGKKRAQTGPSIVQRAAQAGLAVPPSADGELILPPGV